MTPTDAPMLLGAAFASSGRDQATQVPLRKTVEQFADEGGPGIDIVFVEDGGIDQGPPSPAGLEPLTVAAFLAARSCPAHLVVDMDVTYWEPFFAANLVATLDHISQGRAGWLPRIDKSAAAAARMGVAALTSEELTERANEFVTVVRDLWDSWEDGADIRDASTGMYFDTDKLHHINHRGKYLSVRGPIMVPRGPQGQPPTFALLGAQTPPEDVAFATACADAIRIPYLDREAAGGGVAAIRRQLAESGRGDDHVAFLIDVPAAELRSSAGRAGVIDACVSAQVDGVVVTFGQMMPDVELLADVRTAIDAARPDRRGDDGHAGASLRERLGLPKATNRYTIAS